MDNKKEISEFTFTLSDDYCTWEYKLPLSPDHSIHDICCKIYAAFDQKPKEGKFIKLSKKAEEICNKINNLTDDEAREVMEIIKEAKLI